MKFVLEIKCDNAAFESAPALEVARILKGLAGRLERNSGERGANLYDLNGNKVGFAEFDEEE